MDFDLTEQQQVLVDSVRSLLEPYNEIPPEGRGAKSWFSTELYAKIEAAGYFRTARDLGNVEAALIAIEAARLPVVAGIAHSLLVTPNVLDDDCPGPVTLIFGNPEKPQRMLPVAKTAIIDDGTRARILSIEGEPVEAIDTVLGYPYGRFATAPSDDAGRELDATKLQLLRQWARVALSAECAGAARSAVEFTADYVKERHAFGRPIGSFQAVQHRLAQCHQIARGMHFNTLVAAWSGDPVKAHMAAAYAQQFGRKLAFDLHQFCGGISMTTEFKLHYWTFRLRALQPDVFGADASALAVASSLWGEAA